MHSITIILCRTLKIHPLFLTILLLRTVCDELLGPMVFNTVDSRAKELGGSATMLTEFGECYPSFDHPEEAGSIECNFVLGQADAHFQSW